MARTNLGRVGMVFCGAYDAAASYRKLDAVTYLNGAYVAIADGTGNLPTDATHWQPLVALDALAADLSQAVTDADAATVAANEAALNANSAIGYIAGAFDAAADYTAGAYVLKDGGLYRFDADHPAGAWIGTDATQVTVGTELTALTTDIAYTGIRRYPQKKGGLGESDVWTNVYNDNYRHITVPVSPGDIVEIKTQSDMPLNIGFLREYTVPPTADNKVNYSVCEGFKTRMLIPANSTAKYEAPPDAICIAVNIYFGGVDRTPASFIINNIDYAASLSANMGRIEAKIEEKSSWDDLGVRSIGSYAAENGMIDGSGAWGSINDGYRHVVIPVSGGDVVSVKGNAAVPAYIAFLESYTLPVAGVGADFAGESGTVFGARITVRANSELTYTAPDSANYLYYVVYNNSKDSSPQSLQINDGYNIARQLGDTIADLEASVAQMRDDKISWSESGLKDISMYPQAVGMIGDDGYWRNLNNNYKHIVIPVNPGDSIRAVWNYTTSTYVALLKEYNTPALNESAVFSEAAGYTSRIGVNKYTVDPLTVPSDAHFLYVLVAYNGSDCTPSMLKINGYNMRYAATENIMGVNGVNWCAMGDSITEGYVSYLVEVDGVETGRFEVQKANAWAYRVANKNNWNLTNLGIGGTGWNKPTNDQEGGTDTTSAYIVAGGTDFTPFNLVTLAYGINDWKSNNARMPIGSIDDPYDPEAAPTTVVAGMRRTLDAIIASNPHCKIIVILPLNSAGYDKNYGSAATNWALGYTGFTNRGTLEEFVQTMITVCDYYGIQYIDMAHYSCVNRYNLLECLYDGVHPNADTHDLLARELCRKITFG